MKACLGTTFSLLPPPPSPFLQSLPSLQLPFPHEDHCIAYSAGKLKIQSQEGGGGRGQGKKVPENGQNEGMSLGSFLKC